MDLTPRRNISGAWRLRREFRPSQIFHPPPNRVAQWATGKKIVVHARTRVIESRGIQSVTLGIQNADVVIASSRVITQSLNGATPRVIHVRIHVPNRVSCATLAAWFRGHSVTAPTPGAEAVFLRRERRKSTAQPRRSRRQRRNMRLRRPNVAGSGL